MYKGREGQWAFLLHRLSGIAILAYLLIHVFSIGSFIFGERFYMSIHEIYDIGFFRVGLVTSKRVGGAVVRNRVRRRLREIVRKHQHALRPGLWLVIVARPAAGRATSAELEAEWLRLLERGRVVTA